MAELVAPHLSLETTIAPEWIDFNGHFNAGYYMVVFDDAVGSWMDHLGLTEAHRELHDVTTFTVEGHITYDREVTEGEPVEIRTQLLGFGPKAIHSVHLMYHGTQGWLAATNEFMSLHISNRTRRSAPMHDDVLARLAEVHEVHRSLPVPAQVGRIMAIR